MKKQSLLGYCTQTCFFAFMITLLFISTLLAQQPTLNWIGTLGGNSSIIYDISPEGSVAVGVSTNSGYAERAFRWSFANGMENLGTLGGDKSKANGVSSNGEVIVGSSDNSNGIRRAFIWTVATGMQDMGVDDYSEAVAVSDDGSVVVYNNGMDGLAYIWTSSGGSVSLGTLGGSSSTATDISSDGSVVVGFSYDSSNDPYAFRWVNGVGMENIGTFYSFARAVSGDGNTVTGSETGAAGLHRAFKWTVTNGFEFNIAGNFTYGLDLSGDGSIIVGDGDGAIRITSAGVENLNQVYSSLLTAGSFLNDATGISSDGLFIVGNGTNSTSGLDEGYFIAVNGMTSVNETKTALYDFSLSQNYPNPFNPTTNIQYTINSTELVSLKVYDVLGNEIVTLVNEQKPAGTYVVEFNSHSGKVWNLPAGRQALTSGIYFYKLQAGYFVQTKKMILVK